MLAAKRRRHSRSWWRCLRRDRHGAVFAPTIATAGLLLLYVMGPEPPVAELVNGLSP